MPIEYDHDGVHFYDTFGQVQTKYFEPSMAPQITYNSYVGVTDGNFKLMSRDGGTDYYIIQRVQTNESYFNQVIRYPDTSVSYTVGSDGYLVFSPYRPRQWINVEVNFWNTASTSAYKKYAINRPAYLNLAARTIDGVLFDRPRMKTKMMAQNYSTYIDFSCIMWLRSTATNISDANQVYYNPVINGISLLDHIFTDANSGTLRTAYYDTESYVQGSHINIKTNGSWKNWSTNGMAPGIDFYTKYDNAFYRFNYMWVKDNNTWKSIYRHSGSSHINITS